VSAPRRSQPGFTIVELAISVAITTTIVLALGSVFLVGYTAISRSSAGLGGDNTVANASVALTRDVASAATILPAPPVSLTPGSGSVVLSPGGTFASAAYTIDGAGTLLRTTGAGTTVAARGVAKVKLAAGATPCQVRVTITPAQGTIGAQALSVSQRTQGC